MKLSETPAMGRRAWFYAGHMQDRMSIRLSNKVPFEYTDRYSRLLKVSRMDVVLEGLKRRRIL